jgi:hypothetical protein
MLARGGLMFGHGRSRRVYRVYAEDDFPGDEAGEDGAIDWEDSRAGDGAPIDADEAGAIDWEVPRAHGDAPAYTPSRRGLRGSVGGRSVGIALLALSAMAVSAIVVHVLRAGLEGSGPPRSSLAASGPAQTMPAAAVPDQATRGTRRVPSREDTGARRHRPARGREASARPVGDGSRGLARDGSSRRARAAVHAVPASSGEPLRDAGARAPAWTPPQVPVSGEEDALATATTSPGTPEFGFER